MVESLFEKKSSPSGLRWIRENFLASSSNAASRMFEQGSQNEQEIARLLERERSLELAREQEAQSIPDTAEVEPMEEDVTCKRSRN